MVPNIALSICLIFCFYIFWQDSKKESEVSPAIWIPVLWMMRAASRSIYFWLNPSYVRDITLADVESGSPPDRIFFIVLMFAAFWVLLHRKVLLSEMIKNNFWLFFLFGLTLISVTWSFDIGISFRKWVKATGDLIVVLVAMTEKEPLRAIESIFKKCAFLLIPLSIILIKYFPHIGRLQSKNWLPDMWIGVSTHKNPLGQLCLISILYFLYDLTKKNKIEMKSIALDCFYILMIIYLLNGGGLSRSMTSIVLIFISIFAYFILGLTKDNPRGISTVIFSVMALLILAQTIIWATFGNSLYGLVIEATGKTTTLTGRTDLWRDVIALGKQKLIFGYGYGGFWDPDNFAYLWGIYSWKPMQAHNGFIEVFLNNGLVGLIILAIFIIQTMKKAISLLSQDFNYGRVRIVLLTTLIFLNYTEASFLRPTHPMWFVFLLASFNVIYPKEQGKSAKKESNTGSSGEIKDTVIINSFKPYQKGYK